MRFDANIGLMPAYNALVDNARGEIIAQLGDDDVCLPDRLARTVAVFDAHPDAGVAHGDAIIIDADGRETGTWTARQFGRRALLDMLFFGGNHIISPTAAVTRTAYDACGGYEPSLPIAGDIDFWLRAAATFGSGTSRGGPVVRLRRHGANYSDESQRDRELEQVEQAVRRALGRYSLRDLAAGVDWDALPQPVAERRARLVLSERFAGARPAQPGGGAARRGAAAEPAPVAPGSRGRIVLTSFGFNDPGGGTVVPRLASRALAARGWDVTVFHAAVQPLPGAGAYAVREWEEDGVRLVGVFNRPHGLLDIGHPRRELDDPAIAKAFGEAARPRAARRRPLPQPPQPRPVAGRRDVRARHPLVLHAAQPVADLRPQPPRCARAACCATVLAPTARTARRAPHPATPAATRRAGSR